MKQEPIRDEFLEKSSNTVAKFVNKLIEKIKNGIITIIVSKSFVDIKI